MQKRFMKAISLAIVLIASLSSCNHTEHGGMTLASFSYANELSLHKAGDAGVKTSDFLNTDLFPIDNQISAVERAKNECTIDYNAASEYYDEKTGMWRIDFLTLSIEQGIAAIGNCQSVYLDGDGITHLVVYGE